MSILAGPVTANVHLQLRRGRRTMRLHPLPEPFSRIAPLSLALYGQLLSGLRVLDIIVPRAQDTALDWQSGELRRCCWRRASSW